MASKICDLNAKCKKGDFKTRKEMSRVQFIFLLLLLLIQEGNENSDLKRVTFFEAGQEIMTACKIATEWAKYTLIRHAITQKFVILQN